MRPFITSIRTEENIKKYDINGRIYTFIIIKLDDGIPFGYCYKLGKYALLYPDKIISEGEKPIEAILI